MLQCDLATNNNRPTFMNWNSKMSAIADLEVWDPRTDDRRTDGLHTVYNRNASSCIGRTV